MSYRRVSYDPSARTNPGGSNMEGNPAVDSAFDIKSFRIMCRENIPFFVVQDSPCVRNLSTGYRHTQVYDSNISAPIRIPDAMRRTS